MAFNLTTNWHLYWLEESALLLLHPFINADHSRQLACPRHVTSPRDSCTWPLHMNSARNPYMRPCATQLNSQSWVNSAPLHDFAKSTTFLERRRSVVSARDILFDFFHSYWEFPSINLVCLLLDWPFYTSSVKTILLPPERKDQIACPLQPASFKNKLYSISTTTRPKTLMRLTSYPSAKSLKSFFVGAWKNHELLLILSQRPLEEIPSTSKKK